MPSNQDYHFPENLQFDWSKHSIGERTKQEIIAYIEKMNAKNREAFDAGRAQGREEGEVALARKVLSVAWVGNPMTPKGMTLRKRLNLLKEQMNKIIPDPFTPPKEQEAE